jgi:hypothetical protein
MMRKIHPAEEIDTGRPRFYENLIRVQGQLQSRLQKRRYFWEKVFQVFLALMQNDEIVGIPDAMGDFHISF